MAILALILVFASCQKDQKTLVSDTGKSTKASDYFPMAVGNYWIYENYSIDSNGVETRLNQLDSVFVSGTFMENGHTYFTIESQYNVCLRGAFRDSLGYLVTPSNHIQFAPDDFSDSLAIYMDFIDGDTLYVGVSKMEKVSGSIVAQAGNFHALLCRTSYEVRADAPLKSRDLLEYRSPNVGVVIRQYAGLMNPVTFESRLVRYYIQ